MTYSVETMLQLQQAKITSAVNGRSKQKFIISSAAGGFGCVPRMKQREKAINKVNKTDIV